MEHPPRRRTLRALLMVPMLALVLAGCGWSGGLSNPFTNHSASETPREGDLGQTGLPRWGAGPGPELPPPPGVEPVPPSPAVNEEEPEPVTAPPDSIAPARVGLLLPLTGPQAPLGESLLHAAEIAVFDLDSPAIEILPRDTGGTAGGGAAAARSAIADGAELIIGPIFAEAALAAARIAQPKRVPVVAFPNDADVRAPGLFLMGYGPTDQIRRVLDWAADDGARRVAAIVPANAYGDAALDAVYRIADARGMEVIDGLSLAMAGSDPDDFRVRLQALLGGPDAVDALVLPMTGGSLLELVPYLTEAGLDPRRTRLLGTEIWEHPGLTRASVLRGSVYAAPSPAGRAEFRARYTQTFGTPPARIATVAWDATALATMLAAAGGENRFSTDALTSPNGFLGSDGLFRLRRDGSVERGLALIQVTEAGPRLLQPAPSDFRDTEHAEARIRWPRP